MLSRKKIAHFVYLFFPSLLCFGQGDFKDSLVIVNGKEIRISTITEKEFNAVPSTNIDLPDCFPCDSIEKTKIAESKSRVWRDKWKLFLKLENGTVELIDSVANDRLEYILNDSLWNSTKGLGYISNKYNFIKYYNNIGYYLLIEYFEEGSAIVFINEKTGKRYNMLNMPIYPAFSPDYKYVFSFSNGLPIFLDCYYRLTKIGSSEMDMEWAWDNRKTNWIPTTTKWFNNNTIFSEQIFFNLDELYQNGISDFSKFKKRYIKIKF